MGQRVSSAPGRSGQGRAVVARLSETLGGFGWAHTLVSEEKGLLSTRQGVKPFYGKK
jgi:hypothetical protein